ncbi:hypothetical protein BVRB_1g011910 [Beta vulgaris subsp. vulgaris]|nr:hypothetical protein BVRB_1g011910 [Beta vulgaris subsp. vulgaris]
MPGLLVRLGDHHRILIRVLAVSTRNMFSNQSNPRKIIPGS